MTHVLKAWFGVEMEMNGDRRQVEDVVERALRGLSDDAPVVLVSTDEERGVRVVVYRDWTEECPRRRVVAGVVWRLLERLRSA